MESKELFQNLFNNATNPQIMLEEGYWTSCGTDPGEDGYIEPVYGVDSGHKIVSIEDFNALKHWFILNCDKLP